MYLFYIQTRDGKRVYAVKSKTDIIHTVDIFEENIFKKDITIASGAIIEAMKYGIYIKKDHKDASIKKIINNMITKVFNKKDILPEPKGTN